MTYFGPKIFGNFRRKTGKPTRARDKREGMDAAYLEKIRRLPSCVSGARPCQAHHLRIASERGVSLKATDRWSLPLTPAEHLFDKDCVHTSYTEAQEREWFLARGIDPKPLCEALWAAKHSFSTMLWIVKRAGGDK